MKTRPLYPSGRLSVPIAGPHGERHVRQDHELISRLRDARAQGAEAMVAVERYDPDFSVKLSACTEGTDADQLLDEWLERRLAVLKGTQSQLRHLWHEAQAKRVATTAQTNAGGN